MTIAKWEHLTCEFEAKPHKWKREIGQRGRKPRFCPRHKPTPVSVSGNGEPKTLHCELGNHDWIREPTRGRVPTSCPEHRVATTIVAAPRNENGKVTLHCEIGKHDWERDPQRGRKPTNCPLHLTTVAPRSVPVNVIAGSETGDPVPEKKKRGRPRIHETPEAAAEAALEKSRERASNLEAMLKERGTHISQQTPYILYKKVGEKAGRKGASSTITWEKVTEHSPLAQQQYLNTHATDFETGAYRYERNGKVVVL